MPLIAFQPSRRGHRQYLLALRHVGRVIALTRERLQAVHLAAVMPLLQALTLVEGTGLTAGSAPRSPIEPRQSVPLLTLSLQRSAEAQRL
jgi:hypothetical protein